MYVLLGILKVLFMILIFNLISEFSFNMNLNIQDILVKDETSKPLSSYTIRSDFGGQFIGSRRSI